MQDEDGYTFSKWADGNSNSLRRFENVLGDGHYIAEFTEDQDPGVDCVAYRKNLWSWNGISYSGPEYVNCNGKACTCITVARCNADGPNHSVWGHNGTAPAWKRAPGPLNCN